MAIDALRQRSSAKAASQAAAKQRREKIALGAGILIFVLLLALEGPKTLSHLHGSSASSPPLPAPTTAQPKPVAAPRPVDLGAVRRYSEKDPFVPQVGSPATSVTGAGPTSASGPAVRASHFVSKDPFVPQVGVITTSAPAVVAKPTAPPVVAKPVTPPAVKPAAPATPAVSSAQGLVVIVASIPLARGKKAADQAAAAATARGVPDVHVVVSSDYPTLRAGYYAVYSGTYATSTKIRQALQQVRSLGYPRAYTRRLARS
jgi:hypothetical protein